MTSRHAPDRRALALAIGVHALLLAAFLSARVVVPTHPDAAALAVFDVPPPPPPPPPVVVEKVPPPPPTVRKSVGGSPPPAPPPPPERVDVTPQPAAPPVPSPISDASPFASDGAATQLVGTGKGVGGTGNGVETGTGDGVGAGGVHYARAEWIRMPSLDAMRDTWPRESLSRKISGHVELGCIVPRAGRPRRCWLLSETPKGIGFGRAALGLWGTFRIRPVRRNGEPFDMPVIVSIAYNIAATPSLPR